jgi:predicted DCC family thiol-disulfide oxidoreductase YuxK
VTSDHPTVLFDGVCNLCNGLVQFVIRRDPPPPRLRFAALQSEAGTRLVQLHGRGDSARASVVLVEGGRAYAESTAVLRTLRRLGFPWSLCYAAIVVPRPVRDAVYCFVARHRYRWFGKRDACMVPTPELRSRFLDSA